MKKLLTICAILILVAIAGVFYFAQNENLKDLEMSVTVPGSPTQIETISDEKQEVAQNEEVKVDASNWKTYQPITNVSVIFPSNWFYTKLDTYGIGFVSNKKYKLNKSSSNIPSLNKDEVRVQVGLTPANVDLELGKKTRLSSVILQEKNSIEQLCLRKSANKDKVNCAQYKGVCSDTQISEDIGFESAIVSCLYRNQKQSSSDDSEHILKKEIIFQNENSILIAYMVMSSYNKSLINKEIFNTMFDSMFKQISVKYR